jgi:hypothetical protein
MAYDRCSKQRFAKSKTAFRPESSHPILSLQFPTNEAITPNRLSSCVLLRHLISRRRLTFLTYLFARSTHLDSNETELSRVTLFTGVAAGWDADAAARWDAGWA